MHLGFVLSWGSEYVDNLSERKALALIPMLDSDGNFPAFFGAGLSGLLGVYLYVIRHYAALHKHPSAFAATVENTYERFFTTLQNIYDTSLAASLLSGLALLSRRRLLLSHAHAHQVSVKCTSRFRGRHEYVLIFSFHSHESESFASHLYRSYERRKYFLSGMMLFLSKHNV